jgi:hypothetical protein
MRYKLIMPVFCLTLILMSGLLSACSGSGYVESVTNRDVINYRDFSLDAAEVGLTTRAEGTVFVRGDLDKPDAITVQIAILVEIDPEDWGGVNIHFPEGWKVTQLNNSLVEINEPYYSNLASAWTGGQPEQGGRSMIYIGSRLPGDKPTDAVRKGILVIDADYVWEDKTTPEKLTLIISVGSKDGYIQGPVSMNVEIPLLENYRPYRIEYLFPRQHQAEKLEKTQQIEGKLVLEDGLLRIDGYLILWPFEYWGWSDTETVWIKYGDSDTAIARVGDTLIIPGYEVNAYTARQKTISSTFYDGLQGPFWLADTIVHKE